MAKELKVLSELKQFEQTQIKRVEKAREKSGEKLQQAKEGSAKNLENEKDKAKKTTDQAVLKAKEAALKSASGVFDEYRKKQTLLEKAYKKNFSKAVNQVLAELTK